MFELFYNFSGWNQKLFTIMNLYGNSGKLPHLLNIITSMFFIGNFAIYYLIYVIYCHMKLKKISEPRELKIRFWSVYNKMVKIGISYAIFGFSYGLIKFSTNLPRPFCSLAPENFASIINVANERCLSSFPSAHTGLAILITYHLWSYLTKLQKIYALAIILTVGLSRIILAMHYPADILYSIPITISAILIGNLFYKMLEQNLLKQTGKVIFGFLYKNIR